MTNKNKAKVGFTYQLVASTVLVGIVVFVGFLSSNRTGIKAGENNFIYQEVNEIQERGIASFVELSKYFTRLAERKGGEHAFRVLSVAPIPPGTDMHLLGHAVGDVLYKQRGVEGIKVCTQDFRNACSHSIVIGLLLEKGEDQEVLSEITDACKQAPGGKNGYTMCFHGLGHGVFAYTGYELPPAIEICNKTGTQEYNHQEAIECIGGAVMEIISGGFHNKELWLKQSQKYLLESDPLSPCNSDFMPENARPQCYTYLTPHFFSATGGNIESMTQDSIKKAFSVCSLISKNDSVNRMACYGGFGKEFVVLAKNRDIRTLDKMTDEQMHTVINWCNLSEDNQGAVDCLMTAAGSIYWGGENDPEPMIRYCGFMNDPIKDICFTNIIGLVNYYISDTSYRRNFCGALPERYNSNCLTTLIEFQ